MGARIVIHSFGLIFRNLGAALRASVGPYLVGFAACWAVLAAIGVPVRPLLNGTFDPRYASSGVWPALLAIILCLIILLFVSSWVAVAWHRYVLLEESPGALPAIAGRPIWPYVGRGVLIAVLMVLLAIPLGFVAGLVMIPLAGNGGTGAGMGAAALVGLVTGTVMGWVSMRIGLILPAVAVGRPIPLGESWRLTAPQSGAILVAMLILLALNIGVSLVFGYVLGPGTVTMILDVIVNWISAMLGISILTTLYGLIVERRPIS